MKKKDFKKLALLGLAAGCIASSQPVVADDHAPATESLVAGRCGKGSCDGSSGTSYPPSSNNGGQASNYYQRQQQPRYIADDTEEMQQQQPQPASCNGKQSCNGQKSSCNNKGQYRSNWR